MSFAVIFDVHGEIPKYLDIRSKFPRTVQLGDLGFDYRDIPHDSHHVFFKGNHDNYDQNHESDLGDYGMHILGNVPFFFIRGGHSIDKSQRNRHIDYWPEEELEYGKMRRCEEEYKRAKPDIVITHECPVRATRKFFTETSILHWWGYADDWSSPTSIFLDYLMDVHKPKLWIFGHHHAYREGIVDGTHFFCSYELDAVTLEEIQS